MKTILLLLATAGLAAPAAFAQDYQPPPSSAAQPVSPGTQPVYTPPSAAVSNSQNEFTIGGWIAGVGIYYLQPKWSSNPAFSTLNTDTNNVTTSAQQNFTMNGQFAPLVYLGYMSDSGIGVRARWWQFKETSSTSVSQPAMANLPPASTVFSDYPLGIGFASPVATDYNNQMGFDNSLTMDVADVELIWDVRAGNWSMLFGAGVRFAHLNQDYNASWLSTPAIDPSQDTIFTTLQSGHNFDGIGPVASLEGRYALGTSGFAILTNIRGALLFGSGTQSVLLDNVETDPTGAVVSESPLLRSQSTGGVLPVVELELGAEWGQRFGFAQFSIQAAMVGQAWFFAGNAANQDFSLGSSLNGGGLSNQDPLGLIGFRVAAALTY